jgi:Glu-tRNA(Gln) amidotransferase subunit E-like FAD-binding protein
MTLLTDSEQRLLLSELCNTTRTKVEAVLRQYGLDRIPAEIKQQVDTMAREQKKRHQEGEKVQTAAKRAAMQFFKGIGWIE